MSDSKKKSESDDPWRGGTMLDESEAAGHTLPESERDKASVKPDGDAESVGHPGVIPPPD